MEKNTRTMVSNLKDIAHGEINIMQVWTQVVNSTADR
jgi:hypothetical protein